MCVRGVRSYIRHILINEALLIVLLLITYIPLYSILPFRHVRIHKNAFISNLNTYSTYLIPLCSSGSTVLTYKSYRVMSFTSRQVGSRARKDASKLWKSVCFSNSLRYSIRSCLSSFKVDTLSSCCMKARRLNGWRSLNGEAN